MRQLADKLSAIFPIVHSTTLKERFGYSLSVWPHIVESIFCSEWGEDSILNTS